MLLGALRTELDARDQLDWEPWWVDRTPIRASRAAAGARKNGGPPPSPPTTRSAAPGAAMAPRCTSYGTGLPLSALLLPGQRMRRPRSRRACRVRVPGRVGRPRSRPRRIGGDTAYHARRNRQWLRDHGIGTVIPPRRQPGCRPVRPVRYDPVRDRGRTVIEHTVGVLKDSRSLATRFEQLALHFLNMGNLAIIQRYRRLLAPDKPARTWLPYRS